MKLKIYNLDGTCLTLDGVREGIKYVYTNDKCLVVENRCGKQTFFPLMHIKCYEITEGANKGVTEGLKCYKVSEGCPTRYENYEFQK